MTEDIHHNKTASLSDLLEMAITMEFRASDLYRLYSGIFEQDRDFWWRLSMEEQNHAALLKSARNFIKVGKLPGSLLYARVEGIRAVADTVERRIAEYRQTPPTAFDAYHYAHAFENSAVELHFQKTMQEESPSDKVTEIFQNLGQGDRDHAARIEALMKKRFGSTSTE